MKLIPVILIMLCPTQRADLVRVIDGDTIMVAFNDAEHRVRLLNVDTPERGEEGFAEASAALELLLSGRRLVLQYDGPGPRRDRYGRILAYVWADGVLVNLELVRLGHSTYLTRFGPGFYAGAERCGDDEI